jgi:hypothetical protein
VVAALFTGCPRQTEAVHPRRFSSESGRIRFTATHPHGDHVSPNQKREVGDRFPAFPNLALEVRQFLGLCEVET